jgi:hypothetical protein
MSKKKKKLKDDDPMPADVQAQADILDMQTPPPAPDPVFKDPDTKDIVEPAWPPAGVETLASPWLAEAPAVEQMQLFDDNHQIVDELEKFQQEITDQISKAYDAIVKKKIEIGILDGRKANIKVAIDMALALLGKEPPAAPKDEAEPESPQPLDGETKPEGDPVETQEEVPAAEGPAEA